MKLLHLLLLLVIIATSETHAACMRADQGSVQGVATHFGFRNRVLTPLDKLREAGFHSIRDEVFWEHVEETRGVLKIPVNVDNYIKASLANGMVPVLVLGYGNPLYDGGDKPTTTLARLAWKRYAEFVVQHFKGKVHHYELWNEWDNAIGHTRAGQPGDLARLVNEVAPSLKKIEPNICLIAGAVSPEAIGSGWLMSAINAGLLENVDALSVHTYNYHAKDSFFRTPEAWQKQLQSTIRQLPKKLLSRTLPIYVTEMGWPSAWARYGVSEKIQAAYAQRLFLLAQTMPFLHGLWWYGWQDEGESWVNLEHHFGMVNANGEPKPAWHAIREQKQLLQGLSWQGYGVAHPQRMHLRFEANTTHVKKFQPLTHIGSNTSSNKASLLWAIWRIDNIEESLELLPVSANNSETLFSNSCVARKTNKGWLVQISQTPCLARNSGGWQSPQSQ